jgi:RimJ/RimL family protein N-acetyltransferase
MAPQITLRRVTINDSKILLQWRNDPLTKSNSHNTSEVKKEEHEKWLKSTLNNPNRKLFIAHEDGVPVGTVRADFSDNIYELSWTVSPSARGRGVGKRMVQLLANEIKGSIRAEIKVGNVASKRIAEYVGMKLVYEKDGVQYFQRTSPPLPNNREYSRNKRKILKP